MEQCCSYAFHKGMPQKKSFSRLKLRISYLRSTMCQQRLHGFILLSIEKELSNEINYDNLMNDCASKKVWKVKFQIKILLL